MYLIKNGNESKRDKRENIFITSKYSTRREIQLSPSQFTLLWSLFIVAAYLILDLIVFIIDITMY